MTVAPKKSPMPIMTEERLRSHWFAGPQVPFWEYNPAKITIGIEVEYFIAKSEDTDFTLATSKDYLKVMQHLVDRSGYKDHKLHDQPGRISKDTRIGFIAIKPDFAWHILEISLPPRPSVAELRELITSVLEEVDSALAPQGLRRLTISCLPGPRQVELVGLARLCDFTRTLQQQNGRGPTGNPFCDPYFPAYTAATHIHLNAFNDSALHMWPALFAIEKGMGEIYSRGRMFSGVSVESVRSEFLKHSMGPGYKLKSIPDKIPCSLGEYAAAMNASSHAFPHDRFFPVRDVSYIRPSIYGTIEFRSACSTPFVEDVLEIACWRMTQLVAAHRILTSSISTQATVLTALRSLVDWGVVPQAQAQSIRAKVTRADWGMR